MRNGPNTLYSEDGGLGMTAAPGLKPEQFRRRWLVTTGNVFNLTGGIDAWS